MTPRLSELGGLEFILGYIFIAILIFWGIFVPIPDDFFINTIVESEAHTRIFCFMLAIVLIQFNLYRHWKWYIVFRAYRYVKQIPITKPPSYDEVEALKNNDNYES
uniref:Uncharacterized protein n=1 Tax=Acrobeloides nanus TaxID=290746 RepID=A0A914CFC9_9BILA